MQPIVEGVKRLKDVWLECQLRSDKPRSLELAQAV